ncbi:8-amino-7-oxononanoate synthase [Streptomyces sp. NPDC056254]|uniref:8-amino-7-oxononanoate synthase n=1 Tax=unclassified Streptomyces TaxID=2593676 RepID=UPI0005ED36D8|nr:MULTISPECIES: 8-amino-7-oxononanoate synthase [unclassified Streptomyces]APU39178.1 8-amino-7-oxononanoate synthase [Streptomyces sp. TN58]KJK54021.1 8-amino-7-oxononanoate synthase [Streptomyces sp. NRRL F-4428]
METERHGDPHDVFAWIDDSTRRRDRAGLTRRVQVRGPRPDVIDFGGNDYLGLTRHPGVVRAVADASLTWGAGSTGSRLATGTTEVHTELERELAEFTGAEAALVFSSGYLANLGAVTALARPGTLIASDAFNHASLIDGYRLSGAEVVDTAHADPQALERVLAGREQQRAVAVTESVFSVDGDLVDLGAVLDACRRQGAGLLVDDAHGFGVVGGRGEGAVTAAGLAGSPDVVTTITLSKSLGAQGGAVIGPRRVVDHVMNMARSFLFDTGLAPGSAAGALAALRVLRAEPDRPARTRAVAAALAERLRAAGLPVTDAQAAVVSVRGPSAAQTARWAEDCLAEGVKVACFRPPSVPDRFSRIRLTSRADLTEAEIDRAIETVVKHSPW